MRWPFDIDVNGYPPPVLTPLMRATLQRLAIAHASRELLDPPRWEPPIKSGSKGWPHPRTPTLTSLCQRGLAQFIPREDRGGYWRISANGRKLIQN